MQEGITERRIEWIDVARGILITLVILGHALAETSYKSTFYRGYILLFRWITVFHMPAFFIISGMLFNPGKWRNRTFFAYVKRKAMSLLVPYFVFEGYTIVLQVYILKTKELKDAIINTLTFKCNLGADWFLPTLFLATITLFFINRIDGQMIKVLIATLSICVVFFCDNTNLFQLVIGRSLIGLCFIIIGYIFRDSFMKKSKSLVVALMAIVTVIIAVINGQVSMYEMTMNNPILFVVGSIFGTLLIFNVSLRWSSKTMTKTGENSLVIMGTHQHILYCVRRCNMTIFGIVPTILLFLGMYLYSNIIADIFHVLKNNVLFTRR